MPGEDAGTIQPVSARGGIVRDAGQFRTQEEDEGVSRPDQGQGNSSRRDESRGEIFIRRGDQAEKQGSQGPPMLAGMAAENTLGRAGLVTEISTGGYRKS